MESFAYALSFFRFRSHPVCYGVLCGMRKLTAKELSARLKALQSDAEALQAMADAIRRKATENPARLQGDTFQALAECGRED